ncbi:hypothetical protein [Saccharopolyspora phatthalungensis]|uniref:DNA-binding MarR family transcriptional regulator n=1 Tax=Saccharopolyspora phatthalungensis TaxID=664693 RepID=A0A840QGY3_9PSEU|nr:hypothetical protein [Saccharopolyspora phatthalungensis]MBB5157805.1 DNA-binding MarR family transcriptional regulator [Saccharopolyspora phatthalungensis]
MIGRVRRLARLEAGGLISRTASRRYRREVDLRLTEAGREPIDRLFPARLGRERVAPPEPDEREKPGELLAKVLKSLAGSVR